MKHKNIVFLLVVILILISLLYLSLKIFYSKPLPMNKINFYRKSENQLWGQELIPNYSQIFDGHFVRLSQTIVKINSDGFRDREFTIKNQKIHLG